MFQMQGYQVTKDYASVSNLRQLKGKDVFYFIGHGGLGIDSNNKAIYIICTTDTPSFTSVDTDLADDIRLGRVGYAAYTGATTDTMRPRRWKASYYITPAFVAHHMFFNKYSLVFINGCAGVPHPIPDPNTPSPEFHLAFFAAKASAYVGWDEKVNSGDVRDSAEYFFDRLLSASISDVPGVKQSPPVRPFEYLSVLNEMATAGRVGQPFAMDGSVDSDPPKPGEVRRPAKMVLIPNPDTATNPDTFGLLVPTIADAMVTRSGGGGMIKKPDGITMHGKFGNSAATRQVFVGGKDLTAQSTFDDNSNIDGNITVTVKDLPATGPGSHGDVYVTVGGHKSNVVQITEWRGSFVITQKRNGDEIVTLNYTVHLRGILNSLRRFPDQTPMLPALGKLDVTVPDGTVTWDASGSDDIPSVTETISRSGFADIPLDQNPDPSSLRVASLGVGLDLTLSPPKMSAAAFAVIKDGSGLQITTLDKTTGKTRQGIMDLAIIFAPATDYAISLDAGYNIVAGKWTGPGGTWTYQSNNIPAVDPPDPSAARSATVRSVRSNRL